MLIQECRELLLKEPITFKKYKEYMVEQSNEPDSLTEDEWTFADWVEDLIDEYGRNAYLIKMNDWNREIKRNSFKVVS